MLHPHLCRSLLFPVAQYIALSRSISIRFSWSQAHTHIHTHLHIFVCVCIYLSLLLHTLQAASSPFRCSFLSPSAFLMLYPSTSVLLPYSLRACSASSSLPVLLVSPLVSQHAHVSHGCMGARARSRTQCDRPPWQRSTDAEYLQSWGYGRQCRVYTTAFRTHTLRSRALDRPPRRYPLVDPSHRSRNPSSLKALVSCDSSKRHGASKTGIQRLSRLLDLAGTRDEGRIEGKSYRRKKPRCEEGSKTV